MDSSVGYTTADAADLILDHTRELANSRTREDRKDSGLGNAWLSS